MRIVFVADSPVPAHTIFLNELAGLVDLHVIYMSGGRGAQVASHSWASSQDPWRVRPRFPYSFHWSLPVALARADFGIQVSAGVAFRLRRLRPDVIIVHSWGPLMIEPILWRVASGRRAVMWTESTVISGLIRHRVANYMRAAILSHVDAFISNGTKATEFVVTLGVPPARVITSCMPADAGIEPDLITPAVDAEIRFLFVGRLVERKRPMQFLRVFGAIAEKLPTASATIVGDGPMYEQLRQEAAGLGDRVRFVGRAEGEELRRIYASSDVLVVPAVREVWGLVVNEALAAGLFVIATDEVASAADLVNRDNGVIIAADDTRDLQRALLRTQRIDRSVTARVRRAQTVAHCTARAFAVDMHRAAQMALDTGATSSRR
jgi:glycosyltransferase involved in cell wall biosynthesis